MTFMAKPKLYMIMLGCTPPGRHTEQHDLFFTIHNSIKETIPAINHFWPEAAGKIHIDAWREVTEVNGYKIEVVEKHKAQPSQSLKLFFINLGGYKQGEFDEPHYKLLVVASTMAEAIKQAKQTAFYKHTGFAGAQSHIDDRFGVDVDDVYEVHDILPESIRKQFSLVITAENNLAPDEFHLGYLKLFKN
jgi:hypothetical protein